MFGTGLIVALIEGEVKELIAESISELIELGAELSPSPGSQPIAIFPDVLKATSVVRRVTEFFKSHGESEIERLVDELRKDTKEGGELIKRLSEAVEHPTARRQAQWVRTGWAKSRQDWLDEKWRHDWRSQPRDLKGRWVPGRLPYPVVSWTNAHRQHVSRRGRKIRRFKNKYRRVGRDAVRGIVSSWGRDGN